MTTPQPESNPGIRWIVLGLLVNVGLAGVKLITGLLGNSYALVADAIESGADIFASAVIWGGVRIADRPADEEHPYGHGKAEALAALVVVLMLFVAGIGIAIQAVREILRPHEAPAAYTLWVLIGVVVIKELLFRFVQHIGTQVQSSALTTDAWHHRSDALTSAAAAIGIAVSLIGGPRYAVADDVAALVAAAIILINACRLMLPPLHELMDRVPADTIAEVRRVAGGVPGVLDVEKVNARKSGTGFWVDMHLEVNPEMSVREAHRVAHDAKEAIMLEMPSVRDVLTHIEPHGGVQPKPSDRDEKGDPGKS